MYDQVLLVDDDPITNFVNRRLVAKQFTNAALSVFERGAPALDYLEDNPGQSFCIFLDIHMPEMNGWEFLEALQTRAIPFKGDVIVLSSSIEEQDRNRAFKFNLVYDFVSKPLSINYLRQLAEEED